MLSNNITLIALILLLTSNGTINTTQLLLLLALLSTSVSGFNLFGGCCGNNCPNSVT